MIGAVETVIEVDGQQKTEWRYYIVSKKLSVEEFAKCVHGHWQVELIRWFLDVIFKEDDNKVMDKTAAYNLNILRQISLYLLSKLPFPKHANTNHKKQLSIVYHTEYYLDCIFYKMYRWKIMKNENETRKIISKFQKNFSILKLDTENFFMRFTWFILENTFFI